jgi:hypothetical protein
MSYYDDKQDEENAKCALYALIYFGLYLWAPSWWW